MTAAPLATPGNLATNFHFYGKKINYDFHHPKSSLPPSLFSAQRKTQIFQSFSRIKLGGKEKHVKNVDIRAKATQKWHFLGVPASSSKFARRRREASGFRDRRWRRLLRNVIPLVLERSEIIQPWPANTKISRRCAFPYGRRRKNTSTFHSTMKRTTFSMKSSYSLRAP